MESTLTFQEIKDMFAQIAINASMNEAKYLKDRAEAKIAYENLLIDLAKRESELKAELSQRESELKTNIALREEVRKKELDSLTKDVNKKIGNISDSLGLYAESAVEEALVNVFNEYGIPVKMLLPHAKQTDEKGQVYYELDLLVYNTKYIIVIEVKHRVRFDDIADHLERMEKIMKNPMPIFEGKTILSGIATLVNNEKLEREAIAAGLFYIKPSGDTVALVNDKATFKQKEWRV